VFSGEAFQIFLPVLGQDFNILTLIGIGFAVGLLGGFFGMGGGWIGTPALNVFGFPIGLAIGTGLANVTGQSAIATIRHARMRNVDYGLAVLTGVFMAFGVQGGAWFERRLEAAGLAESVVGGIYVVFLATLGGAMLYESYGTMRRGRARAGIAPESVGRFSPGGLIPRLEILKVPPMLSLKTSGIRVSLWVLAAVGLLIGFLAGLMGTGGGFALVPAFIYLVGLPTTMAVGTSLLCILIGGAWGAFTYACQGNLELVGALWMLLGAAAGVQVGVAALRHVRGCGIRMLYSVMLLVASGSVAMKQLGRPKLASFTILGGALLMCLLIAGKLVVAVVGRREAAPPHQ